MKGAAATKVEQIRRSHFGDVLVGRPAATCRLRRRHRRFQQGKFVHAIRSGEPRDGLIVRTDLAQRRGDAEKRRKGEDSGGRDGPWMPIWSPFMLSSQLLSARISTSRPTAFMEVRDDREVGFGRESGNQERTRIRVLLPFISSIFTTRSNLRDGAAGTPRPFRGRTPRLTQSTAMTV